MDRNLHRRGHARPDTKLRAAAVAVALLGAASSAAAFYDDRLQVFVGENVTRDSNIFRLGDGNATVPDKGDTFRSTTVGFNVDAPVSRQRFQFGADVSQVRYNRFKSLDRIEHNGRLNWLWQAGDQWSGNLGYTETKGLASFVNFTGLNAANPLRTQIFSGSANYLLTPSWQMQAIASEQRLRNGLDARKIQDVDVTTLQLGANYISAANNRIGALVRQDEGRYPNPQSAGGTLFTNNYSQRGIGATTDWSITAKSHVAAQALYVRRDYENFSGRDYSGFTWRAAYDWLATAKTSLSLVAQQDISSTEDLQTAFVLVKGIAATPSYAISEKLRLSGTLSSNIRDYRGDAGLGTSLFAGREDRLHAGVISLSYLPLRSVTVLLSAQREKRTSNMAGLDYTANVVNVSGRLTF